MVKFLDKKKYTKKLKYQKKTQPIEKKDGLNKGKDYDEYVGINTIKDFADFKNNRRTLRKLCPCGTPFLTLNKNCLRYKYCRECGIKFIKSKLSTHSSKIHTITPKTQ